jgi:putative transposase
LRRDIWDLLFTHYARPHTEILTVPLNETLFTSLAHARSILAAWKHDYNTVRPHSKLGGRTLAEIAGQRGWGHAPNPVAITSTISHQSKGLYF